MIDATADPHGITISTTGTIRIRVHAKGMDPSKITQSAWDLPGLKVSVTSDSKAFSKSASGQNLEITYEGITGARWDITPVE